MDISRIRGEVRRLVEAYDLNKSTYQDRRYSEAQVRLDFIDPFFSKCLGWDINNESKKPVNEREVIVEESLRTQESTHAKKPDYTFRLSSTRRFFVEAKKPSVDVINGDEEARQIRRYGYTAKLPISVLTNFENLVIYDCSSRVNASDKSKQYVVARYHYTEYVGKIEEILEKLGKDSVYSGVFDSYWSDIEYKVQNHGIDKLFLKQINEWRLLIAKDLVAIKSEIDMDQFNDLIQSYINSIIFLRVAEDRGLEDDFNLYHIAEKQDRDGFVERLKESNKKYNAGLFDLTYIDKFLANNDSSIWHIISELYYPQSSYSFSVLPHDILGQIYEIFLGEKAELVNGTVSLVPKDIDRDIVTTPNFIIKHITKEITYRRLVGKRNGKLFYIKPDKILKLKFADIACGSGAFLLELYQHLQGLMVESCIQHDDYSKIEERVNGEYKLNYATKKKLLTDCIYGVDKDFNAVKATKFGLLLKLLEDETNQSIESPALPNLENIIFGNSLVDSSDNLSEDVLDDSNPADLKDLRFDFIIGNPPYLSTEHVKQTVSKEEFSLYKNKYESAFKQYDKYFLFIERAKNLLNDYGKLSYIVPSKFIKIESGKKIREVLADDGFLRSMVYFGSNQVFDGKTTYTAIINCQKSAVADGFRFCEIYDLPSWKIGRSGKRPHTVTIYEPEVLKDENWILRQDEYEYFNYIHKYKEVIGNAFEVCNGIQTSTTSYIHKPKRTENGYVWFDYKNEDGKVTEYKVEKELTRPYYATERSSPVYTYKELKPNRIVIYPYKTVNDVATLVDIDTIEQDYPFLHKFLLDIESILHKRNMTEETTLTNWHRYGRNQNISSFDVEQKLIVGILSQGEKYCIENHGTAIPAGGTAGYCFIKIPENSNYSIYFLQALLHSKYMEYQARIFGKTFDKDFVSRGRAEILKMKFPKIDFENEDSVALHNAIANTQESLNRLYSEIEQSSQNERQKTRLLRQFKRNEIIIKGKLKELFNLPDSIQIPEVKDMYSS